jgi:siroheme synthase (precorrin-2 oxidase/ferrochelatase)
MALDQKDLEKIEQHLEEHIKKHLGEWLAQLSYAKPPQVYKIELRERMVRVEEELKNQRQLILQFMEQVDKHFEQVDKRFEQVDKCFEQVDKRFEIFTTRIDRFMVWSFGTTLTVGGLVVAAIKLLP